MAGVVPAGRLWLRDHWQLYTASASERDTAVAKDGYTFEFIAGYVFGSPVSGSMPLYRLYSAKTGDHFYTMSAAERDTAVTKDGYAYEGIACYVFGSK